MLLSDIFFKNIKLIIKIFMRYFKKLYNVFNGHYLMIMVNLICLFILIFNLIDMTMDYLKFKYYYKLNFDDKNQEFILPQISLCTDEEVMFDKEKFLIYFSIENEYENYKNIFNSIKYTFGLQRETLDKIREKCGIKSEIDNQYVRILFR